jgi:hypothetical protein
VLRSIVFFTCLTAVPAFSAEFRGQLRASLGPGIDTNARRDFLSKAGVSPIDGFLFGLAQLEGSALFAERVQLLGSYDVGARKFLFMPSEDTIVQAAQAEASVALVPVLNLGALGSARDRRGAERDYTDLTGGLLVDVIPNAQVDLRLTGRVHRFFYYNQPSYGFWASEGGLMVRYRFDRRHRISAQGNLGLRNYDADATSRPSDPQTPSPGPRKDTAMSAGASYAYRGRVHFSAGYLYSDQSSNSWGESLRRHRFFATAGFPLPWELAVLTSGTLQLSSYPDGVYLSPELLVVEDDENSSSISLKVLRPIGPHLEVDLRYAIYVNAFPQNQLFYVRHVASVGIAVSF